MRVRRALLRWFRRNARPLPWRRAKSPYTVWVSEVMLQQTQIKTVIPYYRRFLRAFPNVERLAAARLDQVLRVWSGLGYYRRARDLHRTARFIARNFRGRFPDNFEQARSLPGVGDYTAKAVLSIAYNLPFAVLEGNVARVLARLLALRGGLHQPTFRRAVDAALDRLLSPREPGNFNQAVMDLGQTLCVPRAPRCPICPIGRWCRAYRHGNPESYPLPRPRRATESRYLAVAIIRRHGSLAMVRGLDEGLLGDLWNFPAAFGTSQPKAFARLHEKMPALVSGPVRFGPPIASLRHGITYRSIRVHLYPAEIPRAPGRGCLRWFPLARLGQGAVSQLARKIAAKVAEDSPYRRSMSPRRLALRESAELIRDQTRRSQTAATGSR